LSLQDGASSKCAGLGADGTAHVVWHDERHGSAEIYYRQLR